MFAIDAYKIPLIICLLVLVIERLHIPILCAYSLIDVISSYFISKFQTCISSFSILEDYIFKLAQPDSMCIYGIHAPHAMSLTQ